MTPDDECCWVADQERLHCFLLVDDDVVQNLGLSSRAGPAFIRAFIVEDRTTGEMSMKYRFRYIDPDERMWYRISTDKRGREAVEQFESGLRFVLDEGARLMGRNLPDGAIQSFYPPDDGGDATRTLMWLDERDLIEIKSVEDSK